MPSSGSDPFVFVDYLKMALWCRNM